jgi:DNA-binding LytR/AlgR family response regulator
VAAAAAAAEAPPTPGSGPAQGAAVAAATVPAAAPPPEPAAPAHAGPAQAIAASETADEPAQAPTGRIPYEREGRIRFVPAEDVAAIRAEGHYTLLYFGDTKALCPWSISEADRRLAEGDMIRTHRSYIVNRRHVTGFERKKDTGVVFFEDVPAIAKAPVSRARLAAVREHLGL